MTAGTAPATPTEALVSLWASRFGDRPVGVADLFELVGEADLFPGDPVRGPRTRLGLLLRRLAGQTFAANGRGPVRVEHAGTRKRAALWRLAPVGDAQAPDPPPAEGEPSPVPGEPSPLAGEPAEPGPGEPSPAADLLALAARLADLDEHGQRREAGPELTALVMRARWAAAAGDMGLALRLEHEACNLLARAILGGAA